MVLLSGIDTLIRDAVATVLPSLMFHTINLYRMSALEGELGESVLTPVLVRSAIPCSIQTRTVAKLDEFNKNEFGITHVLYFDSDPGILNGDILSGGSMGATKLEIVNITRDVAKLGSLFVVETREVVA
jgi:hypothetical protein